MESFFRYISYIDFYDNYNKIKNVGFLRWKFQNGKHNIEMQIKDVNNLHGNFKIEEKKSKKTVGNIKLDQGIGNYTKQFSTVTISDEMYLIAEDGQIYINEIEGFYIWLKDDNYLFVPINLPIEKKEEIQDKTNSMSTSEIESASENVLIEGIGEKYIQEEIGIPIQDKVEKKSLPMQSSREDSSALIQNNTRDKTEFIQNYVEEIPVLMHNNVDKYKEYPKENPIEISEDNDNIKILEPLHEDKWQQLSKKYPVVHPFPNKVPFLSIKPEDFIILQKGYQKLVHNSFLLHGFYNYGHLILGKLAEEESAPLYLGVPGVYYDREKQAAQMFGFVGFESTEQPVQAESYGYYMIEVMI